jgi:hypothetical protein
VFACFSVPYPGDVWEADDLWRWLREDAPDAISDAVSLADGLSHRVTGDRLYLFASFKHHYFRRYLERYKAMQAAGIHVRPHDPRKAPR